MTEPEHANPTPTTQALVGALLAWYDKEKRNLPWREHCTPYRSLLSELMLQQTRVDTALPYFERFTSRWPTLSELAGATEEEVTAEWAGLGYYSRARNLLKTSRLAHAMGGLPADVDALQRLPGIGRYTAGAIASIAFGIQTPVVDGNVARVISRLDGRLEDPQSPGGAKALWQRAGELVPAGRPGDFNQGLMELGALVCTPRAPKCDQCPWSGHCVALAKGVQGQLPAKKKRPKPVPIRGVAGLLRTPSGWLIARRPSKGLLASMWEPPGMGIEEGEDEEEALKRGFRERLGIAVDVARDLGTVDHVFSHRRLSLRVFEVVQQDGEVPSAKDWYSDVCYATSASTREVALSRLARKALELGLDIK